MAGFDSNKNNSTWEEWHEQLVTMLELNGYNPAFCDVGEDSDAKIAYDGYQAVDDYFYDNFEADE